jgi:Tfp pilus assembly pilus retraction ATPase PilT
VLASTPLLRQTIREGRLDQLGPLQRAARGEGSLLLEDALADLVRRNLVEEEDALAFAGQPGDFYAAMNEQTPAAPGVPLPA